MTTARSASSCGTWSARSPSARSCPTWPTGSGPARCPRELHATAAKVGLLGVGYPEAVGGGGGDLLDSATVTEEIILSGGSSGLIAALFTHGIALPHIIATGDAALIDRYVRPTLAGELIGALAVTEPDGGSDVAALRTTARRDGDHYVVNGAKTFITSGARADFVTTAVRTGGRGHDGVSLLVDRHGSAGLHRHPRAWRSWAGTARTRPSCPSWTSACRRATWSAPRAPASARSCATSPASGSRWRCRPAPPPSAASTSPSPGAGSAQTFGAPLASRQVVRHRLAEMARVDHGRPHLRLVAGGPAGGGERVEPAEVAMAKNTAVGRLRRRSSTPRCSCTAAPATCATPKWSATTATPASWASAAAPPRS